MNFHQFLPSDPTPEEVKIADAIVSKIYEKLSDPSDKFILAYCFHLGFGREETARALGVSHVTVWKRVRKIQRILSVEYKVKETKKVSIQ